MSDENLEPVCVRCVHAGGLCRPCTIADQYQGKKAILPHLRINNGWLKLIGDVLVEQKKRQTEKAKTPRVRPPSKAQQKRAKKNQAKNAMSRMQRGLQGDHLRNTKAAA